MERRSPRKCFRPRSSGARRPITASCSLAEVEEGHILAVLESTGWNKSRTARILGISRQGLLDRLKRMKIEANERGA